ncbi:MAG: hypothetical protein ABFE08_17795 [Armatimonadia bacterium]
MPPVVNDTTLWLRQAFPTPVVVTLILYTMGASTYVSSWKSEIEAKLSALEKVALSMGSHENRLVVLEQQFIQIREDLAEIKLMLREKRASAIPKIQTLSPASALPEVQ